MIRKATKDDISSVAEIYTKIILNDEGKVSQTGWKIGVYPTESTALEAWNKGELFVLEVEGSIVAAARLNREQEPAYKECPWALDVPDDQVMVMHTLVVDPDSSGNGYATRFVNFYEDYALRNGCISLRMDTNMKNIAARALYKKLGFREVDIIPCSFNGIEDVRLVCLEKNPVLHDRG